MSRAISVSLQEHFGTTVPTLAYCVKVTRRDGDVKGFTSTNKSFTFEEVDYEAGAAAQASAVRATEGTGVDNLDVAGIISSESITELDLRAGKYNNARVSLFVVNYEDLTMGKLVLLSGSIGQLQFEDGRYIAEVRSLFQRLSQAVGELTSKTCRVRRLGDSRCRVDLTPFTFTRTVGTVVSTTVIRFAADANATDFYTYGEVEMRSGPNKGERREVKSHELIGGQAQLTLHLPFPYVVTAGEVGVLIAGCRRRLIEDCKTKFNNIVNFRGEPYIPGTDQLQKRGRR